MRIKIVDEAVSELQLTRLDFDKIDVEGFTLDVLNDAQSRIGKFMPQVFLEFNSFTSIAYGNQNPRHVLNRLKRRFPYVCRFDGGMPHDPSGETSIHTFIHDNLLKRGCVDDLFCSFEAM